MGMWSHSMAHTPLGLNEGTNLCSRSEKSESFFRRDKSSSHAWSGDARTIS